MIVPDILCHSVVNRAHGQNVNVRLYQGEERELLPQRLIKAAIQRNPFEEPSVVTPKPANGGQGKTGQREEAGD
jgi:hypothetical protein